MEKTTIWYFTDTNHGIKISDSILHLGLSLNRIDGLKVSEANIDESEINIAVFDLELSTADAVFKALSSDQRLNTSIKFIMLPKKDISHVLKISYNIMHLEFIGKPVDNREFLLLLEKTIIVERYREIMKLVSLEAENRIEAYEGLININRKNIFESDKEKGTFEKILTYEKNLMREQSKLNNNIKEFTLLRQSEYFDLQNRILAEEMLNTLRRKEMLDAKNVIDAQESLIDYSAHELDVCKKIISASENAAELGRSEAIELHDKLQNQIAVNEKLAEDNARLKNEVQSMKKQ